jgi:hypothetical protein
MGWPDSKETEGPTANLDSLDSLDRRVSVDMVEIQDPSVLQAHLGPLEEREPASQGHLDQRGTLVNQVMMATLDSLEYLASLDQREDRASLDHQVPRVGMDCLEKRETLGFQVCLAWREVQVCLVVQDLRESLDGRESRDFPFLDPLETMVCQVGMVCLVARERRV